MFCSSIMLYLFQCGTEIIQVNEGPILVSPILTHKGPLPIKVKLNLCTL
jgi:hypothetical protein